MNEQEKHDTHVCPGCGTENSEEDLSRREYRCRKCSLEMAHLDFASNGLIRGVFGWLHNEGETIVNRYRVKSVLGKGGFGATYLVEDLRLNRKRRALKEVPALLFDEYETNLLSRLHHPSIPDIIDRAELDDMIYLVLEFGGTRTLGGESKHYPQQRIPQSTLLPWMRQLSDVLIYLHSQDPPIVHRDLKPDNILLDENDRIMLIDFGIAKESAPATMTRTLGRAATHGFSPPEQAMGTGTDERSDIYSLAATFYALLTGQKPPAAHERVAGKELLPLSQCLSDVDPQLDAVVMQALNLNVNHRQQTMLEFSQALQSLDSEFSSTRPLDGNFGDRTVMLGSTNTRSGTVHSPSISLPSARITTRPPTASSGSDVSGQYSRNNALILGGGVLGLLIVLTLGYVFWPKEESTAQQEASIPAVAPQATVETTPSVSPQQPPEQAANAGAVRMPPPVEPSPPITDSTSTANKSGGSSALDALNAAMEENKIESPPEPQQTEVMVPPKPKPATVRPAKTPTKPKKQVTQAQKSNNDWLKELKGSVVHTTK